MVEKSAAHCEGYLAFQTRKECRYTPEQADLRIDWAAGFMEALGEFRSGKRWWKSNTFRTAIVCMVAGIVVILLGRFAIGDAGGNNMMMATGSGISIGSILSMFVRTAIRSEPVSFGGYNNQSFGQ